MKITEFIKKTLIEDIEKIQQVHGYAYISFSLISQGIELLGSLIDSYDFTEPNKSKKRFNNALKEFFPEKYKDKNLYDNLRCGLLHIFLPQKDLVLSEQKETILKNQKNLKKYKQKETGQEVTLIIAEDFFNDFKYACNTVIALIESEEIFDKYSDLNKASENKKNILLLKHEILNTEIKLTKISKKNIN